MTTVFPVSKLLLNLMLLSLLQSGVMISILVVYMRLLVIYMRFVEAWGLLDFVRLSVGKLRLYLLEVVDHHSRVK